MGNVGKMGENRIIERGNLIIRTEKNNYRTEKNNYRTETFNYRTDPNPRGIGIRRSTQVRYFTVLLYSWLRSIILAPPVRENPNGNHCV